MADPAKFGHDQLGHLLSDTLLTVPNFQRQYSWLEEHVVEYWTDIVTAQASGNAYFMGSIVLAIEPGEQRRLIVDGQQRITTTALLFCAVRDRLYELNQQRAAQSVESDHLSDYVLAQEQTVAKLILSPADVLAYGQILERTPRVGGASDNLSVAYLQLKRFIDALAPAEVNYKALIELVTYIDTQVQVLLAVATGIPEAYVIFETLNDRGADLTTADLLKNYLFSRAGSTAISHAQSVWTIVTAKFDKADDLVKFLRYDRMSRAGRVTNRSLYKALQSEIGTSPAAVTAYLDRLSASLGRYTALREPDDASWSSQAVEVKDSLLAFRRFGFESSMPLLLAAFGKWTHTDATRFVDTVASWSVRAWFAGTLGGGVAESSFCDAAVAITSGKAKKAGDLLPFMAELVPDDNAFKQAIRSYGSMTTTRAKYLLARLERQYLTDQGKLVDAMPDWSSKSVTVEHLFAKSMKRENFSSDDDFNRFQLVRDQLANFALLERTLNNNLEDKPFSDKAETYKDSSFELTQLLGAETHWGFDATEKRVDFLADLATRAWPR